MSAEMGLVIFVHIHLAILGLTPQGLSIIVRHVHIEIRAFSMIFVKYEFQLSFSSRVSLDQRCALHTY